MAQDYRTEDDHIEITPARARQGTKGVHVLTILGISVVLAFIGLIAFFIATSASS